MQVYENEKLIKAMTGEFKNLFKQKEKILEEKPKAKIIIGDLPILGDILIAEKTGLRFMVRSCRSRGRFIVSLLMPE